MRWDVYDGKEYFPDLKGLTWMAQGSKIGKNGKFRVVRVRKFATRAKAMAWVNKMRKAKKR